MADEEIHRTINDLVEQERQLRAQSSHTEVERASLTRIEESLDQCWDLLRQRDALRNAGDDPDAATVRPVAEVEGYEQ
jgi:hypothetical protein